MPIIIAQDGMTELETGFVFDDQCLYAFAQVSERPNASSSIDIYIDPKNKNHTTIEKGVYKFNVSADDKLAVYQGEDGQWATQTATGIKWKAKKQVSAYVVEIAIPWALLGGKPALNKRIGLNVALNASDGYTENISSNEADKPYTWCTLKLK
ncbi:sugar-binding protein [Mucilaginibacter antarcticus]